MKPPTPMPRILDPGDHADEDLRADVELLRDPVSDHPVDYTAWAEKVMRDHAQKRAERCERECP